MGITPEPPGGHVRGAFGRDRDPGPRRKHAQRPGAEIGGHANEVANVEQLRLAMFRDRAAEVVVGGDGVDLDALILRALRQFQAPAGWQIQRIPVRPLAIDLDAVVSVPARPDNDVFDRQCRAAGTKGRGR